MDFKYDTVRIFNILAKYARSLGRGVTRWLLTLFFVLKDGDLSFSEKIMIYAALVYVLVPNDLLPRRVFHLLGLTDDALAIAIVLKKMGQKVTPAIEQKVERQLDSWFGYEIKSQS